MTITLWHNPRCSKSRAAVKLLEEAGAKIDLRIYLKDSPDRGEILALLDKLGLAAGDLLRPGEQAAKAAGLGRASDPEAIVTAMVESPILIERPIAISGNKAVIGRPPEAVLTLL